MAEIGCSERINGFLAINWRALGHRNESSDTHL